MVVRFSILSEAREGQIGQVMEGNRAMPKKSCLRALPMYWL
jgi:hypothetical protein